MTLKHLDLFSGIGGFTLAAQMVGGIETKQFVEIDPYCQKVLAKNFPGVPIHDDIKTYSANPGDFDLITFGSPCQDFSCANPNGRGLEGERSGLFYEAIRLLCVVRPRYAVFENVANVLTKDGGMQFQQILRAFYESGFDAEWQVISAASVGAPHLRERVFIVAYSREQRRNNGRNNWQRGQLQSVSVGTTEEDQPQRDGWQYRVSSMGEVNANSHSRGCNGGRAGKAGTNGTARTKASIRAIGSVEAERLCQSLPRSNGRIQTNPWGVEPGVLRVAHGIPNRIHRIRGLGNAIVPQCGAIALQRVLELEVTA